MQGVNGVTDTQLDADLDACSYMETLEERPASCLQHLLAKAATQLPIGTAYAVWVGIGAAGAAILGMILFQEPAGFARLGFLFLLVISIVGLKLTA